MDKNKKKFTIKIIIGLIAITMMLMVVVLAIPSGTLADLMKDKVEVGGEYRTVYKTKTANEYTFIDVEISSPEGIDAVWNVLEGIEVSFKGMTELAGLEIGEIAYEITDMQHMKSIQVTDSGEVYTMLFNIPQISVVYGLSDEEIRMFFSEIEKIREVYGEE